MKVEFCITDDFDNIYLPLQFRAFHNNYGYCYMRVQIYNGLIIFTCAQLLNYYNTSVTNAVEAVRESIINMLINDGVITFKKRNGFFDALKSPRRISSEFVSQVWDFINNNSVWVEYYDMENSLYFDNHYDLVTFEGNHSPSWVRTSLEYLESSYPDYDFIVPNDDLKQWSQTRISTGDIKKILKDKKWTNRALAERWGCSEVWISRVINNQNRDIQWEDAFRGLPPFESRK
ncbi:TPA: hypothetical protein O8U08_002015 [Enterobacter cloacae]|nr:hypothetical protein [Enterobacter cloacae]